MSEQLKSTYPIVPLRNIVVFPKMVVPLFVGRSRSLRALEEAGPNGQVVVVAQKDSSKEDPNIPDLYKVGVVANISQSIAMEDGVLKVLIEGSQRVAITKFMMDDDYIKGNVKALLHSSYEVANPNLKALKASLLKEFEKYIQIHRKVPVEALHNAAQIDNIIKFCDAVSSHVVISIAKKQEILECTQVAEKLQKLLNYISEEINMIHSENKIKGRVRTQIEKQQKDYYLNEQLKAIHKELGDEDSKEELHSLGEKIRKMKLPKEVREKAQSELKKLKTSHPMSADNSVIRNYLDWIISLPWNVFSPVKKDLQKAQEYLDAQHYGLEKIKERIVEYLAVHMRTAGLKSPILCLIGPPGVGKTSLVKSIADAVGRKYVKISLGGLRDEAEIRGHRRTYVGALPGKIIQAFKKAKVCNPVILLDEIDKMSSDYRGDPASALLEVLDPEQNNAFNDHYLELDYDLSKTMFIATANTADMPRPLLDRLEIINVSGYVDEEKKAIATNYLIHKQFKNHGIKPEELTIDPDCLHTIIKNYTREAGVRSLDRALAKISRKAVKEIVLNKTKNLVVSNDNLEKYLGIPRYTDDQIEKQDLVGITNGLAYSQVGGSLLAIEVVIAFGKGDIKITGKLGEVMKESAQAALSYIKSRHLELGINPKFFSKRDLHIHVPEGATPKDGPSAGIAMCTSMVSAITGIPVDRLVAMTGEITLRGRVLPIGGLKEKLLAALRAGVTRVLIPKDNVKDLAEIPDNIKGGLDLIPVETVSEVLSNALLRPLTPIEWDEKWEIMDEVQPGFRTEQPH